MKALNNGDVIFVLDVRGTWQPATVIKVVFLGAGYRYRLQGLKKEGYVHGTDENKLGPGGWRRGGDLPS